MRKRPRRFTPIAPEAFKDTRHAAGMSLDDAAELLRVSTRTIRHWEKGRCRIPYPAFRLLRLRVGLAMPVDGWEGWSFGRDGTLWSPTGKAFRPEDMDYLALIFGQARLWRESQPWSKRSTGTRLRMRPVPVVVSDLQC
jgi:transcriptional regulator with XRE-family HTH domain